MGCRIASAGLLRLEEVGCRGNLGVSGSIRGGAVGMGGGRGREVIAAPRALSPLTRLARAGLRRRRYVGWHGALVVCELSVFCICFLGIDLRSAGGQSPPTRRKVECKRGVAGRRGSLWSG